MIRALETKDIPLLIDIGNRAWKPIYDKYRKIYGEELFLFLNPNFKTSKGDEIYHKCENEPEEVLVCEEENRIVGFITFSIDKARQIGIISNNAVDPECGLKGLGQQMYKAILSLFRKKGLKYVKVSTGLDEAHTPARRAYERAGFNISRSEITYYMKLSQIAG